MRDIYEELETKDAYELKYKFIEKWTREGLNVRDVVDKWLMYIDKYTYGDTLEEELKGFNMDGTAHLNFYKEYDIVGELVSKTYKPRTILPGDYERGKKTRTGATGDKTGNFRGIEYMAKYNSYTEENEVELVVIDESMGIRRTKKYQKMPTKLHYLYDMAFFLDTLYVPYTQPGTVMEIVKEVEFRIKYEYVDRRG